jgi:hypothetical protein
VYLLHITFIVYPILEETSFFGLSEAHRIRMSGTVNEDVQQAFARRRPQVGHREYRQPSSQSPMSKGLTEACFRRTHKWASLPKESTELVKIPATSRFLLEAGKLATMVHHSPITRTASVS